MNPILSGRRAKPKTFRTRGSLEDMVVCESYNEMLSEQQRVHFVIHKLPYPAPEPGRFGLLFGLPLRRLLLFFGQYIFQNLPFSLHAYTILPISPDGYRVSCSFKPTRCLHDAYISLHDFGVLQRGNKNQLTHLQVFCFLQAKKFSREFCGIQVDQQSFAR